MADPNTPQRESSPQPNRPRVRTLSHRLSNASGEYFPPQSLKSSQSEASGRDIYAERVSFSLPRPRPSISSRASSTISLRRKESDASERFTEGTTSSTISESAVEEHDTSRLIGRRMSDTNRVPDLASRRPESVARSVTNGDKRMSTSSLYSLTSARAGGATGPPTNSANGSVSGDGSVHRSASGAARAGAETAPSPVTVTTTSTCEAGPGGTSTTLHNVSAKDPNCPSEIAVEKRTVPRQEGTSRANIPRSRSRAKRRFSNSTSGGTSHSPGSERGLVAKEKEAPKPAPYGIIGVCALDIKARSKPSRNILNRLIQKGEFEVVVFGDKVILDEDIENWPVCDFLISFYSDGFPLDKAIAYVKARRPFCVNDVPMQQILWDRRICLRILDKINVPTPRRIEVNRDGGPRVMTQDLARVLKETAGIVVQGPEDGDRLLHPKPKKVELVDDGDTLVVDGTVLKKPFVEKPVSGEDHNICIYYPKSMGGGARKLFRKIGNKSSEMVEGLTIPRAILEEGSSYVYEQFMRVDNAEDVKAYTVGPTYCHAETRKSPVVDGLVRRNNHGKEIRFVTNLTTDEEAMAARICESFGQRVCGFDMLRANGKSYVIDVNGWSFVKDNEQYYNKCAEIMRELFIEEKKKRQAKEAARAAEKAEKAEKAARLSENAVISAEQSESEDRTAMPPPPMKREPSVRDNHRSGLSSLLAKSPSISKISNHLHHRDHKKGDTSSPDSLASTIPITATESLEKIAAPTSTRQPSASVPVSTAASTTTLQNLCEAMEEEDEKEAELPPPAPKHAWKLKGMVSVIRHADRTPKQKYKFAFHTKPFIELLKGHQEEVLLTGEAALDSVLDAVDVAIQQDIEDKHKLKTLRNVLTKKGSWPGTKVQIKPMFRKKKAEDSPKKTFGSIADIQVDLENFVPGQTSALSDAEGGVSDSEGRALKRADSLTGVTLSRITAAEESLVLDKLQLIVKWGGEPTHSARYQAQELGENMRNDLFLMNREVLDEVHVFSSSERRVTTSAQIFSASFLNKKELASDFITIRKDLLDDSNAAKDEMDKVKKKLKVLLRRGNEPPPQFAWPVGLPEPSVIQRQVVQLMIFHRKVMRHNYQKLYGGPTPATNSLSQVINPGSLANETVQGPAAGGATGSMAQATATSAIQSRWCCGEDKDLFKERWEKLFLEFCDPEKVDPSKISELYDTMKFDALHNRQFLEWVFTPRDGLLEEEYSASAGDDSPQSTVGGSSSTSGRPPSEIGSETKEGSVGDAKEDKDKKSVSRRLFRRRSGANGFSRSGEALDGAGHSSTPSSQAQTPSAQENYFKLFEGSSQTKAKTDARLEKLRELYRLAKVLFDFICPQEYGISDAEKLEIGLLTSLPLLKEIVADLEEMQASDDAKSFIYFTKESHIYTLMNCILEGGIETKIARSAIPELDYLSQICFELYESETTPSPPPKPVVPVPASGEHATLQNREEGLELSTALVGASTSSSAVPEVPPTPVEQTFAYSIRITISPGAHTYDPLDVQLDSKHCIGCAPRRSLTQHMDWREVIERLREKFGTVKLPKRFLAINLSESHSFSRKDSKSDDAIVPEDVAVNGAAEVGSGNGNGEAKREMSREGHPLAGLPAAAAAGRRSRANTLTVPAEETGAWAPKDRTASVSSLLVDTDGHGGGLNRETLLELRAEGIAADVEEHRVASAAAQDLRRVEDEVTNGKVEENGNGEKQE